MTYFSVFSIYVSILWNWNIVFLLTITEVAFNFFLYVFDYNSSLLESECLVRISVINYNDCYA